MGSVEPGSHHEVPLAWQREGAGSLRLLAQDLGCGCLSLTGLPQVFAEGSAGEATLTLRASAEPGPIDTCVRLVLDRPPPDDVLRLRLSAYVGRGLVVRPGWLDLGLRTTGGRAEARFSVFLPPGVDPGGVEVELRGWPGRVRIEHALLAGQRGPDLRLESAFGTAFGTAFGAGGETPEGPVVGALSVRAAGAGEALVPLRAEVVAPRAATSPSARPGPCPPW